MSDEIIDQVQTQLAYKPFRPFWLETVGGTRIKVEKAEWFHEFPGSGAFVVSTPQGTVVGWWHDLIDTIEVEGPK